MSKLLTTLSVFIAVGFFFLFLGLENKPASHQAKKIEHKVPSTLVLRFGHNLPEESALHKAALLFAKKMQEKTAGKVSVDIYPAQQLGNDHQMVEMARKGELDILLTPTAKMSVPVPSMQYADLPFFFPSRSDVYEMLDGAPGQMLLKDLKKIDLHGLAFWENGFKHFTGNTPLLQPSDFASKKIRVMKSRIIMEQFKSFGAEPVAIEFYATRQALMDRVVDGQENPLIAIYSMGFHDVQSDLTLSEHAFLGYVLSVSEKTMQKLPFDVQQALMETAREVTPWEREKTREKEQELIDKIRQSGTNIHRLSAEQRADFEQKTAHIASQFENIIGPALISKTEELLFEKYGPPADSNNHLVIGLNADFTTSPGAGLAIKRGIQLAIDEINLQGGVLGKQLFLLARDHQIVASKGLDNIKYFIQRPDVVAVVGGKHSAVIAGELETINQAKMPYLIPWAAAQKLTENSLENSSIFRVSANDRLASEFIAKHTLDAHDNPAIIVENTIWGRDNLKNIKRYMASKGTVPAAELIFNLGQSSYLDKLANALNSGADAVILIANYQEANVIIPELVALNREIPIVSHWGILGGNFYEQNRHILTSTNLKFFQTFLFSKASSPQAKRLAQRYLNKYGVASADEITAQHAVAQAYDLTHMLIQAIEQAGSTNRNEVRAALENLTPYRGVIKHYAPAFTVDRHDGLNAGDFNMAHFSDSGQIIAE